MRIHDLEERAAALKHCIGAYEVECTSNKSRTIREAFLSSQRRYRSFANELFAESKNHAKIASLNDGVHTEQAVLNTRARFLSLFLWNILPSMSAF